MGAGGPFQETPQLRVEALALKRGGRVLFEHVSFHARPGELIEIRGANGSGKTSLLRALAGFLRPHAGTIAWEACAEPETALHLIAHTDALKGADSVRGHIRYWVGLFGGGGGGDANALEEVGLAAFADFPARVLSQGQRRRLALARLAAAPRPVWLLDEPAAALDADGKALLNSLIAAHLAQGGIALAAVHEPLGPAPARTVTLEPA